MKEDSVCGGFVVEMNDLIRKGQEFNFGFGGFVKERRDSELLIWFLQSLPAYMNCVSGFIQPRTDFRSARNIFFNINPNIIFLSSLVSLLYVLYYKKYINEIFYSTMTSRNSS